MNMDNQEIARVFSRIADLLEIKGELVYKVQAYRRAAEAISEMGEDIRDVQREGRLTDIPGVGKALAEKINELLSTGRLAYLERLEQEVPVGLLQVRAIPGVGAKTARLLWQQLGVTDLDELEAAARAGRLKSLPGLGARSEARIIEGIASLRRKAEDER